MKKLLIIVLALCVAFAGFLTWKNYTPKEDAASDETPIESLDYDALYASHAPDEVVMVVGQNQVTWDKYFYFLRSNASYIEQMFNYYYGSSAQWDIVADEASGETIGENMFTMAKDSIRDLYASVDFAKLNGAELTPEQEAEVADSLAAAVAQVCGEGGSEADFNAYLAEGHISRELYDMMVRWSYYDTNTAEQLYGKNGEKISDEDALAYLAENQLARANHVLFMTKNMSTGEELDDSAKTQKLEQAKALAEELHAAEDRDALLALFAEKKQELDEDSGKITNPDGYIVFPGAGFVPEFLDTALALEDYQVSDPVETVYGYHVILRVPLGADEIVDEENGLSARQILVQEGYSEALTDYEQRLECEYVNGFAPMDLAAFMR